MNDKKCKVTVEIFGESYPLKGDANMEHIIRTAALVDERMRKVARTNARLSPAKIAVLAALNLADEFIRLETDYQELLELLDKK
ncbi:cell division protein ZapA [Propionispora hippei]|uniref:Cell division protein ZapA n=1 Tax=Propionispora hippei DSM 15287 TaxID=1123003 RepID=A0A1M6LV64_9FIRM|nr:cell division protein ZapA [Propionispora hippei]SHJ75045.1 cell division protein ZapA [Propionispora hippei DSM 15287]